MSSEAERVQTILQENTTLVALATGGIYTRDELGRMGLTRTANPDLWDGSLIKPTIYLRTRPGFRIASGLDDEVSKTSVSRIGVEVIILHQSSTETIETIEKLVYNTLHMERRDSRIYMYNSDRGERLSQELNSVLEYVIDYWLIRLRSSS